MYFIVKTDSVLCLLLSNDKFYIHFGGSLETELMNMNMNKGKVKGKVHPRKGHVDPEGEHTHSSTLSLTSALDGGGWSTPHPGQFTPGKETGYPLYRRLGGPHGLSGWVRKISPPPGFDPSTVQPVASHYTN